MRCPGQHSLRTQSPSTKPSRSDSPGLPPAKWVQWLFVSTLAAVTAPFSFCSNDWQVNGPWGGSVTAFAASGRSTERLLASGRQGLLYVSRNAGQWWSRLPFPEEPFLEIRALLIDPQNEDHFLVGVAGSSQTGLLQSWNAGQSWSYHPAFRELSVLALTPSPQQPGRVVAGSSRGVFLSNDGGQSWKRISDAANSEMLGITAVAFDHGAPDTIYAGTAHLPWKSVDGGVTWEQMAHGLIDDSDIFSLHGDRTNPQRMLLGACSGLYESVDHGATWRKFRNIPTTYRRTHVVAQDPEDPSTIYAGTTLGLLQSTNRGAAWKALNTPQVNAITFDPSRPPSLYLALEHEGIAKLDPQTTTFERLSNGFVARSLDSVLALGDQLYGIEAQGDATAIFRSDDAGNHWQPLSAAGLEGVALHSITGVNGQATVLFGATDHEVFVSRDNGLHWHEMTLIMADTGGPGQPALSPDHRLLSPIQIHRFLSLEDGSQPLLVLATDRGLLVSSDQGESWRIHTVGQNEEVLELFTAPRAGKRWIARTARCLYLSHDQGGSWTPLNIPLALSQIHEAALPAQGTDPILVASTQGLLASTDNGVSWFFASRGLPVSTVQSVVYQTRPSGQVFAYAVQFGQLFESSDQAQSWHRLPTSSIARFRRLWALPQPTDRLWAITKDRGILSLNLAAFP